MFRAVSSRTALLAVVIAGVVLVAIGAPPAAIAEVPPEYAIEKIFYGRGWLLDPLAGNRRQTAFLNLSLGATQAYPDNGTFVQFSQIFIQFSLPADASGPPNGTALRIRFSYYVYALCIHLNASTCPLGPNTSATSQDILDLEIRRLLEYRDTNGDGAYDPGEPIAREVSYAQPESPFAFFFPFGENFVDLQLPYDWNFTSPEGDLTIGALFANDSLLDALQGFRITVGDGTPANLTVDSYLFLRPSTFKGIPLTPTVLKLDLYVGHHSGFAASDTAVALEMRLSSTQQRFSSTSNASSESVSTSSAAATAFFTWDSNATVDGASAPVRSTILTPTESETIVYLSYPRGGVIWHDPVLGLGTAAERGPGDGDGQPPSSDMVLWIALAGALIAGAILGVTLLRRRQ